jgi:hypothetical protein
MSSKIKSITYIGVNGGNQRKVAAWLVENEARFDHILMEIDETKLNNYKELPSNGVVDIVEDYVENPTNGKHSAEELVKTVSNFEVTLQEAYGVCPVILYIDKLRPKNKGALVDKIVPWDSENITGVPQREVHTKREEGIEKALESCAGNVCIQTGDGHIKTVKEIAKRFVSLEQYVELIP